MEREACVCDHGYERSDLCAEIIIITGATGSVAVDVFSRLCTINIISTVCRL